MALAAAPGCGFSSSAAKPGVDGGPGIDAPPGNGSDGGTGSDASPSGTPVCYGPTGWQVCLDAKPTGQIQVIGSLPSPAIFDTDHNEQCLRTTPASWIATQPDACIVAGDTLTIGSLSVVGSRPLVLVAETRITVAVLLDAASHRNTSPTARVGAGTAAAADCKPFPSNPGSGPPGGGGAGGGFLFPGGTGGTGDGTSVPGGQPAAGFVGGPSTLRGGCAGQPGAGGKPDDSGAGGGAVYLVSAGTIAITGTIDVSGAGGAGEDNLHGGGGGGSGGMIVLYASVITPSGAAALIADGGGGGGGSAQSGVMMKGQDGHEPNLGMPLVPATGGHGGILNGGEGGDGGNGYPALSTTMPGITGAAGDSGAGGGGGGGGGGYIQANHALTGAAVSPPASPQP
jgi:hypothetical protein